MARSWFFNFIFDTDYFQCVPMEPVTLITEQLIFHRSDGDWKQWKKQLIFYLFTIVAVVLLIRHLIKTIASPTYSRMYLTSVRWMVQKKMLSIFDYFFFDASAASKSSDYELNDHFIIKNVDLNIWLIYMVHFDYKSLIAFFSAHQNLLLWLRHNVLKLHNSEDIVEKSQEIVTMLMKWFILRSLNMNLNQKAEKSIKTAKQFINNSNRI